VLTPSIVATDRYQEQSLEGATWKVGVVRATSQQTNFVNIKRAGNGDESRKLDGGESPWKANLGRGFGMK